MVEAIFTLAATKSFRTRSDQELIDKNLDPADVPYPFARLQGDAESGGGAIRVEMLIGAAESKWNGNTGVIRKRFRLDGAPRRASDIVGKIKAVLFSPSDVDMVTGPPSVRRRYVDLMLSQVDQSYLRLLQSYSRVVQQRNATLTSMPPRGPSSMLEFWDAKLVSEGSEIVRRRFEMMARLAGAASDVYSDLSGQQEHLEVRYRPSIGELSDDRDVPDAFRERLSQEWGRSRERGITLVGPHRDDLELSIDGMPLHAYGSRGQHRTAVLALRMAEAGYIANHTGDQPLLLLDEALGELDERRRDHLLDFSGRHPQVVLTGTSRNAFPEEFQAHANVLHVQAGEVQGV